MTILAASSRVKFGSKAETLAEFEGRVFTCTIPPLLKLEQTRWREDRNAVLAEIGATFRGKLLAVRSSARCEDGVLQSFAGAFTSCLHIGAEAPDALATAIDTVFRSYPRTDERDQVLIQEMVTDIAASGVILTRCVDDGSPYYVLSYDDETGSTDSVTAGRSVHKTVLVFRGHKPEHCDSPRVRAMLALAREVEALCNGIPLDIEFALDNSGHMYLLQVRRICTVHGWHPDAEFRVSRTIPPLERFLNELSAPRRGLFGASTIFGNMPDWNPAELIGVIPSPLAASLFRHLISAHAWSEGRRVMGYRRLPWTDLMVMLGGRPFIDVRASFNSLLPEGIAPELGTKLVEAWLARLAAEPSLHDKVEFSVAQTVLDFDFDAFHEANYAGVLTAAERADFKSLLLRLTNRILQPGADGSLASALAAIESLAARQSDEELFVQTDSPVALTRHIADLLDECLRLGTTPFATIARHAFVAETLLRSAVARGALAPETVAAFKASFPTVLGELAEDTVAVCQGITDPETFLSRYGHLRPGTFDILSPCYRDRSDLFVDCQARAGQRYRPDFTLSPVEEENLNHLLHETGVTALDAQGLFDYARRAIQGREYGKFIFTRHLSAALEAITNWGRFYHLGREDLAHLTLEHIVQTGWASGRGEITSELMAKADRARADQALWRSLKLSYLVRGVRDIHVVPVHRSEPNFITQKQVQGPPVFIQASDTHHTNLTEAIVCIENADPGFDWIFTRPIAGLVTKYGGANSHMAIRCAELQLPAAIGCGEELFERLRVCRRLELNGGAKILRGLDWHD